MTKDEALDKAQGYLDGLIRGLNMDDTSEAVQVRDAIKQARALDKKAENARELGLDYEPVQVDQATMQLAESVGLIGPSSRTHDLHAAIQRFHDLICVNATIKAAKMAADAICESTPSAQRQWVGLTKEERVMYADLYGSYEAVLATEAKLKERNV
jgi:hypothetical protein